MFFFIYFILSWLCVCERRFCVKHLKNFLTHVKSSRMPKSMVCVFISFSLYFFPLIFLSMPWKLLLWILSLLLVDSLRFTRLASVYSSSVFLCVADSLKKNRSIFLNVILLISSLVPNVCHFMFLFGTYFVVCTFVPIMIEQLSVTYSNSRNEIVSNWSLTHSNVCSSFFNFNTSKIERWCINGFVDGQS